MDNIGGAEYVDLILARELGADIYTTNIDKKKIAKMGFGTDNIFSIGKIPINAPQKQELAYWRFKNLKLGKKYDYYIIGGDWAVSGAASNKPNLWYVYSPIREIWDLYEYTRKNTVAWHKGWIFALWVKYHRFLNRHDVQGVGQIVSISQNVRKRVKKYLNKDSLVIYPPTDTSKYHFGKVGDYWLSVNRLITHKRVDMQLEAFRNLPEEKLVIVGSFEQSRHFLSYASYIKRVRPKNVSVISWVDSSELVELYANCKGFITTSHDEDYGMTAVEAMASGKPVIAPKEGGYTETVIDGKTGMLIENINAQKLASAIKKIGKDPEQYKNACINQAKKFDKDIYISKIKELIKCN
ncbi:MAG: glycosyltransferase [Candidatus Levyibacteriota bacterium]